LRGKLGHICALQSQRPEQILRRFDDGEVLNVIFEEVAFDGRGASNFAGTNSIFSCADDAHWTYFAVLVVLGEQRVCLTDYLPVHRTSKRATFILHRDCTQRCNVKKYQPHFDAIT
jgi:hypothetical protein